MDDFMKTQIDTLNNIKCRKNYDCDSQRYMIITKINNMKQNLEELKRVEDRLSDLGNYLNNNEKTLKIMRDETKNSNDSLNDQTNHFSVENYQLDELNNNKNVIDKKMDLYLTQLKKMFYIICALTFIYFILISFNPKDK